jgi:hypothetical protein
MSNLALLLQRNNKHAEAEVTYYRWRQEFGGLKTEQVKRLKDLELENSPLRKAVSDVTLDKLKDRRTAAPGGLDNQRQA